MYIHYLIQLYFHLNIRSFPEVDQFQFILDEPRYRIPCLANQHHFNAENM
jgi:hypothetical protein